MLLQRYLGPFKVVDIDNSRNNITLDLPPHIKCHNVFQVSLLREWISPDRDFLGRESPQPLIPACNRDGKDEFEVDKKMLIKFWSIEFTDAGETTISCALEKY
jgi:hypothetical protein